MDTGPKQRREVNPRYGANIFSILTFGYVENILNFRSIAVAISNSSAYRLSLRNTSSKFKYKFLILYLLKLLVYL